MRPDGYVATVAGRGKWADIDGYLRNLGVAETKANLSSTVADLANEFGGMELCGLRLVGVTGQEHQEGLAQNPLPRVPRLVL